ncbi:hypothetical protein FH972_003022 [Carpinus fangiana]|uniref:Uncharacterized protein n=1 Tax=Carpinus fangiana TaxID=176857 RepID=A0A5N6QGN5_9ROSI|nr:hypothetical protein FH972_003022 [Carpinus fangiana]
MDSYEDTITMLVDERVGNSGRVVEDKDEGVEGDVGGEGHAGEDDGGNGVAVEGDYGEGGDDSDGSVEKYDSDQLQSPHGSNDDKELLSRRNADVATQLASTIFGNKQRATLGLATKTRSRSRLKEHVSSGREPANKQKLVVDLTSDGPPPIPGGGPLCLWGPLRVGGITFRTTPYDFDIQRGQGTAANHPLGFHQHIERMEKGKKKKQDQ